MMVLLHNILKMNMTVGPTQVVTVGRLLCLSNLDEQIFTRDVFKNPIPNACQSQVEHFAMLPHIVGLVTNPIIY